MILVTGATGKSGREIVKQLSAAGKEPTTFAEFAREHARAFKDGSNAG